MLRLSALRATLMTQATRPIIVRVARGHGHVPAHVRNTWLRRFRPWKAAALAMFGAAAMTMTPSPAAWAFMPGRGGGEMGVAVSSIQVSGVPTANQAGPTIVLGWTPPMAPGPGPLAVWLTRTDVTSQAVTMACGSPEAPLASDTSACTEGPVGEGTYVFHVVAHFRTWTMTGAASAPLTVMPWTTTSLAVDRSTVTYGNEQAATWTASVANSGVTPPTGTVAISSTDAVVCTILLPDTMCTADDPVGLSASADSRSVVATYSGDNVYPGSTSASVGLLVERDTTSVVVAVAPAAVTYGFEQTAVITVTVLTGFGEDLPFGGEQMTVEIGSATCGITITPNAGGGSSACFLGPLALPSSLTPYSVTTTYLGNIDLAPSDQATTIRGLLINAPPSITTTSLPSGTRSQAYSTTLAASGGTSPMTWALASGTLPTGLALGPTTGRISGTLGSSATTKSFSVRVADASGAVATRSYTLTVG